MSNIAHELPALTLKNLQKYPNGRPVVFLMRHSVRGPLPVGKNGDKVPLTEEGIRLAVQMGKFLSKKTGDNLISLHASPVLRCRQTADALAHGLGHPMAVDIVPSLALPGIFLVDTASAVASWHELGGDEVLRRMSAVPAEELPGMAPVDRAAHQLTAQMFRAAANRAGLHVFVTHDSLVLPVAARMLGGTRLSMADWPAFLDGVILWQEENSLGKMQYRCLYREYEGCTESWETKAID